MFALPLWQPIRCILYQLLSASPVSRQTYRPPTIEFTATNTKYSKGAKEMAGFSTVGFYFNRRLTFRNEVGGILRSHLIPFLSSIVLLSHFTISYSRNPSGLPRQ